MSHTHPEEAHHVKKGSHVMLKGCPCKVIEVKTSKTGKHGHAKCNITGIDVLTDRKYNEVHPGHIVLAAFDLKKDEYSSVDFSVADETIDLMDGEGKITTFNLSGVKGAALLEQLKKDVEDGVEEGSVFYSVTVATAPLGEGDKCILTTGIEKFSLGKEENQQ